MAKPAILTWDCETTGLDHDNDRIIQLVIGVADRAGNILEHWEWIINPGVEISDVISELTGHTQEFIDENGRDPQECFTEILEVFQRFKDLPWVAYNIVFDLTFTDREFARHGVHSKWGQSVERNQQIFDPLVIERYEAKFRKGKKKLLNIADHYGIEYDPESLHNAVADVELTAKVAVRVREEWGPKTNEQQAEYHKSWSRGMKQYLLKVGKTQEEVANLDGQWPYIKRTT